MAYARNIRYAFLNSAKRLHKLKAEIHAVEHDGDLMPEGKSKRLAPLRMELAEFAAATRENMKGSVQAAYAEMRKLHPAAEHRRAALKFPERALAIGLLAERLGDADLKALVEEVANVDAPDAVAAYAIRHASNDRLNRLPEAERAELHAALSQVSGTPQAATAVADYIAARVELNRLEQALDPADGAVAVTRAREARTVDLGTGPRTLTDAELAQHYARLSLDLNPSLALADER